MTDYQPVIVTGASRRGGLAICKALAAAEFDVVAVCRGHLAEEALSPRITHLRYDLTLSEDRQSLVDTLKERTHTLRGIIHNASLWLDDSPEHLTQMLALHVEAPFFLNQNLSTLLKAADRADIIHICDDTAQGGTKNHIAYAASKAALLNMTLSFAEKLAPSVRVNAISPGLLQLKEPSSDEYREKTLRKALLEFEPGNQPLADAILYLLNSQYSTGSNLVINGGRHLKRNHL